MKRIILFLFATLLLSSCNVKTKIKTKENLSKDSVKTEAVEQRKDSTLSKLETEVIALKKELSVLRTTTADFLTNYQQQESLKITETEFSDTGKPTKIKTLESGKQTTNNTSKKEVSNELSTYLENKIDSMSRVQDARVQFYKGEYNSTSVQLKTLKDELIKVKKSATTITVIITLIFVAAIAFLYFYLSKRINLLKLLKP